MTTTKEQALVTKADAPLQALAAQINAAHGEASELTLEESAELAALESVVQVGRQAFLQVAAALVTIRDKRLYRVDYSDFESYCHERWGFTRQRAHQLITAAGVADSLSTMVDVVGLNERQARVLAPLTPEDRRAVYSFVKGTAPDGRVTAAHLKSVARVVHDVTDTGAIDDGTGAHVPWAELSPERKAALIQVNVDEQTFERHQKQRDHNRRILTSSASVEWYTPQAIVSTARDVLGGIDLDPSSCEAANATVQATTYYTAKDDGLTKSWRGRVFLNPPYGGHAGAFVAKLVDAHARGDVPAAIVVLSDHAVSNVWFAPLWDHVVVFIGRLAFDTPDGPSSSPTFGTVIVGVGVDVDRFAEVFSPFGPVVARVDRCQERLMKKVSREVKSSR